MHRTLALVLLLVGCASAEVRISLDSDKLEGPWILQNQNKSILTYGRVPGGVYTDLQAGEILNSSLFYRFNDHEYRWVAMENWTYSRSFDIPIEVLDSSILNLVLHGVDTIGEVVLNGKSLGVVNNMFVRYVFPIKDIAKETNNILEVRLQSAVMAAAAAAAAEPIPPTCVPDDYQGECHANMVRKMQASFSWDWGPAFPSAGLWKSVEVEGLNAGVIRDLAVFTEKIIDEDTPSWRVNVTIFADLATETFDGYVLGVLLLQKMKPLSTKATSIINANYTYVGFVEFEVKEDEVEEWWPNGFGDQHLYQVDVSMVTPNIAEDVSKSLTFGFRTVELVQEPLMNNTDGLSFYVKVNGVPIFAKGSNWIPAHVIPERGAFPDTLRHLLQSAKDANMNMLRVWGGGVYESDEFYKIADELGIMIWQDMMFACSMYPTNEDYLASVKVEIEQQIRRLQPHPSVVIWAGNNENEAALRSNWYGTNSDFDRYKADYIKLYVDVIKQIVAVNDPSRPYVVSSPSNGANSEDQEYVADNPYSPLYGDVHYYNYASDGWNSATYPDTRFTSEYGFQAMPSFVALEAVSVASDWTISSQFSQQRQHHPGGYIEMATLIKQHLPLGDDDGSEDYYKKFIYFSQISAGMSTKTESEKYRRDRSKLTSDNKGNTMGALYWQLNDVWEAPTWASIEFNGRWKLLHYLAKKFFAPILVSPEVTPAKEVNVFLVSDLLEDVPDLKLNVDVMAFDSFVPKSTTTTNQILANATSKLAWSSSNLDDLLGSANCSNTSCFLHFSLTNGTDTLSENIYFPASFSDVTLPAADLTVTLMESECLNCAYLNISAKSVAPFVWLETPVDGTFSDNGFTLLSPYTVVVFTARTNTIDLERFSKTLTIRDLTAVDPQEALPKTRINELWSNNVYYTVYHV